MGKIHLHHKWTEMSPSLVDIKSKVYDLNHVLPEERNVFRAIESLDPEKVRVVILGQDPYHSVLEVSTPKQGTYGVIKASGLAFGFSQKYIEFQGKLHSSLLNIRDELRREGFTVPEYPDQWYTLKHWKEQGVLLLNTRLTVLEGKPLSHSGIGWEPAVQELLHNLNKLHGGKLVSLAFGSEAHKLLRDVGSVIRTSHPCKYSNTRTTKPFTGSNCFLRANELLSQMGREPIKW